MSLEELREWKANKEASIPQMPPPPRPEQSNPSVTIIPQQVRKEDSGWYRTSGGTGYRGSGRSSRGWFILKFDTGGGLELSPGFEKKMRDEGLLED